MDAPPRAGARILVDRLIGFVSDILAAAGLEPAGADRTARLMVAADARGADNHGVYRLTQYVRRIQAGGINPRPTMRLIEDHPSTALLDGDNGMGHLVMSRAAEVAMEKARGTGVGWVGARSSNHAGPASLYATMPLALDMIGIYLAVGSANHLAPWGGIERLLSTNPIAIAIPASNHPPVVLDMATSMASYGKVKRRAESGEALPEGWMMDQHGRPLTNPGGAPEGLLMPIGGYKGYGLALMFGLLAGTLNGAALGADVVDFNLDVHSVTNTGHCIIALDVARFLDVAAFKARVDAVCTLMTGSAPMPGGEGVRIPGERSAATLADSLANGVPLPPPLLAGLDRLAMSLGVRRLDR